MSDIGSVVHTVLVPRDGKRPLIGPFAIAHGNSVQFHEETARELGFKPGEYTWREILSVEEALDYGDQTQG